MLRFLSQRTGFRKAILWGFVIILVLGLGIVFVAPSNSVLGSYAPLSSSTVVASVDGYPITVSEMRSQVRAYGMNAQQNPMGRPDQEPAVEFLYPQYGKQALDTLINARLVRREADRYGIGATTKEMTDRITAMFIGPDGKWMGTPAYQARLRQQGLSVEAFERDIADAVVEEKLRNFLTSAVMVSDREIEEDYRRTNTTMTPSHAIVAPKPDAVPPASEEELRAFFDANRERFRITQPQRKIAYLFVSQEAVGRTIAVPDEELRKDYDADTNRFVGAVRPAQVVLRIPSAQADADVRKRAEEIANRARGGEDFAEIARSTSEDKATGANGGDAGWIERASVPAGDPRERLFSMDVGQTSAAIKVGDSYVVYKILERRVRSFEEAREEVLAAARTRRAYSRGIEVAQQAEQKLRETKDPQRAAQEMNASLNAPADAPVVAVRETPYAQPGDQLPDIGSNPQFEEAISGLQNTGDVGTVVGVTNGFAVPMLADKRDPRDATFEEVRDRVAAAHRDDRAKELTRAAAQSLADSATTEEFLSRARAAGFNPATQGNFKAGTALPELYASDLFDSVLLGLPANTVSKAPIELPTGFLVLAQGERKEADMGDAFTKQRDSIRERLLSTKRGQLYTEYMSNLRKKLEESGDIEIYQSTLDRAFDVEEDSGDESVPTLPPVGTPKPSAVLPFRS